MLCSALLTLAATPIIYCQAENQLYVVFVNANPEDVEVGDEVTILFRVIYYIEDMYLGNISKPAIGLETSSFQLSNATNSMMLSDVAIKPTENAGEYTVTLKIESNFPSGTITVYVVENSLSIVIEKVHYSGPPIRVSSVETDDTSDYSIVKVLAPVPTPTPPAPTPAPVPSSWVFALIIIIVVIGAILVYFGFKISRKPHTSE